MPFFCFRFRNEMFFIVKETRYYHLGDIYCSTSDLNVAFTHQNETFLSALGFFGNKIILLAIKQNDIMKKYF